MHIEQEKYNKNICFLLTLVLMLPLLTNFFGSIVSNAVGTTTYSTYAIYGSILLLFGLKYRLKGKKFYFFLILTSIVLGIIILNRIIFPKSYLYMIANREYVSIMLIFYYPIAYAMTSVTDWEHFFKYMRFAAMWTPFLCWFALKFLGLDEMISYMQLSNVLLPGFLAGWYIARIQRKRIYYVPSIVSLYLQIFYGSRMSFASALVFIVLLELFELRNDSSRRSVIKVTILIICSILGIAYFSEIMEWFLKTLEVMGFADSRTVQKLIDGSVFESAGRDIIYKRAEHELGNLGAGMYGFFGDRIVFEKYGGIVYVHNIFYELIFSFGWILGGYISLWLIMKIVKNYFFQKDNMKRVMVSYFVCLIFLRLLVSGTFMTEGQFLLLIGVLCSRANSQPEQVDISKEGAIT